MMRTVGDPSWAHSAAHPTESPPSHLLHSDLSYDRHDDDEAFPTQLPDDIHDQNYNVKVELGLFKMFIYPNLWQVQPFWLIYVT